MTQHDKHVLYFSTRSSGETFEIKQHKFNAWCRLFCGLVLHRK